MARGTSFYNLPFILQRGIGLLLTFTVLLQLTQMLPLSLLNTAVGHPMQIELKDGETYNGFLFAVDTFMNIFLKQVIITSANGQDFTRLEEAFVRGNTIKYLRVPDEVMELVRLGPSGGSNGGGNVRKNAGDGGGEGHVNGSGSGGGGRGEANKRGKARHDGPPSRGRGGGYGQRGRGGGGSGGRGGRGGGSSRGR